MGRATAIVAAIGLMLVGNEALAQTPRPPDSPIAEFQVSPRFWYLFESYAPPVRRLPGTTLTYGADEYAFGGASISARFIQLPETTFIFSGLYGTNDPAPLNDQFASPGFLQTSTNKVSRLDFEFLAQTAIPESSAAWIIGGRLEHHDGTTTGTVAASSPLSSSPLFSFKRSATTDFLTAKGGLTGAVPLTADHNLRLFGNAQIVAGGATDSSGIDWGVVGPDLAIGLQYSFSPTINADLRYRAIMYFLFDVPRNSEPFLPKYIVYQGPMLGINIKF